MRRARADRLGTAWQARAGHREALRRTRRPLDTSWASIGHLPPARARQRSAACARARGEAPR
jgi:hypothetical protein